jgi:hypothetical protein
MSDERCAPGLNLGEDLDGPCCCCGERIERPSLQLVLLILVVVTAAVVATMSDVRALLAALTMTREG